MEPTATWGPFGLLAWGWQVCSLFPVLGVVDSLALSCSSWLHLSGGLLGWGGGEWRPPLCELSPKPAQLEETVWQGLSPASPILPCLIVTGL